MPFLPPNQQRQSTEGTIIKTKRRRTCATKAKAPSEFERRRVSVAQSRTNSQRFPVAAAVVRDSDAFFPKSVRYCSSCCSSSSRLAAGIRSVSPRYNVIFMATSSPYKIVISDSLAYTCIWGGSKMPGSASIRGSQEFCLGVLNMPGNFHLVLNVAKCFQLLLTLHINVY